MPVLVADELSKEYGDVVALADFKLSVEPGELVALVGHNGSGKSTFLRLVAGLLEPSDGVLVVANSPAGSLKARAEVSFVPDQPVLYDDLSVNEHIEFTARLHGELDWPERAGRAARAAGAGPPGRRPPVAVQPRPAPEDVARPRARAPVLDPARGRAVRRAGPDGQSALTELLVEAASAGAAVLVATHQLSFLEHATRCVALRDGHTEFEGPVDVARIQSLLG